MNKKIGFAASIILVFFALPSHAQTASMCAGIEEAAKWNPERDAVKAAPKNHRVLLDNDDIRVLEVTVMPDEKEQLHHHQWPSVMVVDSRPKYINYDKDGNEIKPAVQALGSPEMPIMVRLPPQAEHAIHDIDQHLFHAIRIEYKKICQTR